MKNKKIIIAGGTGSIGQALLFPGVPTIRPPMLSKRIRERLPDLKIKDVF